jgi:thiosulfate/3-mercaptopyruvate sulfurtransferase
LTRRTAISSQVDLLEAAELTTLLAQPEASRRLIYVTDPNAFAQHHIPGSINVAPGELVAGVPPAVGKLPDTARLNTLFARLGYDPDATFILYDDEGGGWAGRFAWTLDMIGHTSWHYLNGGLHAWAAAGGELATGPSVQPTPSEVSVSVHSEPVASLDEVLAAIDDPDQLIWDVRSREEYDGLRSGSARAGHIPGAVNLDWLLLKDSTGDQRLHPDLAGLLASAGVDLNKRTITHCQTHHRSGLSYMVGRLLGCQHIKAYDGSWAEWGNRDDVPVSP